MVLHHLLAGEDFDVFKKMMIEKNMELQIQALNLIKQNQGKHLNIYTLRYLIGYTVFFFFELF